MDFRVLVRYTVYNIQYTKQHVKCILYYTVYKIHDSLQCLCSINTKRISLSDVAGCSKFHCNPPGRRTEVDKNDRSGRGYCIRMMNDNIYKLTVPI